MRSIRTLGVVFGVGALAAVGVASAPHPLAQRPTLCGSVYQT